MTNRSPMNSRAHGILNAIVESYIETGEPVASRTVARAGGGQLSPATIRNVMADLYDEGYLAQPHTSAGRIPTLKAFRAYTETLSTRRMAAPELHRMRTELRRSGTVEERLERTSHLLTEMTHNVGIAAAIPTDAQELLKVELVALADRRVLMIVETQDRIVRNRVVSMDAAVSQEELLTIRNFLNENYAGWRLGRIRVDLQARLAEERARYDVLLQHLQRFCEKGLLEIGLAPEVHLEGTSNLVGHDLQFSREKLREILRTFEEKQKLLDLLERFLEQGDGSVAIQVGLGDLHPSLHDLSLIGVTVSLPSGLSTRVAVLGPLRMNYGQAMSTVFHVGEAIQTVSA